MNTNILENPPPLNQAVGHGVIFLLVVIAMVVYGCFIFWRWATGKIKFNATAVIIDGVLYVCIALFNFLETYFSSDESYKYISPWVLFWLKAIIGGLGAVAGALKMYRSTSYSDHLKAKAAAQLGTITVDNTPPVGDKPQVGKQITTTPL